AAQRSLPITRPFDRQRGNATLHPTVGVEGHVFLLVSIHAGYKDDDRYLGAALICRRQVEHRRELLSTIWNLSPFDVVIGTLHILREVLAFPVVVHLNRVVDLLDRPHRTCPVLRSNEIMVARGNLLARLVGLFCERLAPARDRLEGGPDVGIFLDALTQPVHVVEDIEPAGAQQPAGTTLIPIDAIGLNDIVERPPLLVETTHQRLAFWVSRVRSGDRNGGERRTRTGRGSHNFGGVQELTTIHGIILPVTRRIRSEKQALLFLVGMRML